MSFSFFFFVGRDLLPRFRRLRKGSSENDGILLTNGEVHPSGGIIKYVEVQQRHDWRKTKNVEERNRKSSFTFQKQDIKTPINFHSIVFEILQWSCSSINFKDLLNSIYEGTVICWHTRTEILTSSEKKNQNAHWLFAAYNICKAGDFFRILSLYSRLHQENCY